MSDGIVWLVDIRSRMSSVIFARGITPHDLQRVATATEGGREEAHAALLKPAAVDLGDHLSYVPDKTNDHGAEPGGIDQTFFVYLGTTKVDTVHVDLVVRRNITAVPETVRLEPRPLLDWPLDWPMVKLYPSWTTSPTRSAPSTNGERRPHQTASATWPTSSSSANASPWTPPRATTHSTPRPRCDERATLAIEYDTGTERLARLVDKIGAYDTLLDAWKRGMDTYVAQDLFGTEHPVVLFVFTSPRREIEARAALNRTHTTVPIATGVRPPHTSPAQPLWLPLGARPPRLRPAQLHTAATTPPTPTPDTAPGRPRPTTTPTTDAWLEDDQDEPW